MSYDNTKFYRAFDAWLASNVEQGFGEEYAGALLADFDDYLAETGLLKRSPGRVVFGRKLADAGFERRKVMGLTHWSGLTLKKPRNVQPTRYTKTIKRDKEIEVEREAIRREKMKAETPEARSKRLAAFHKELEEEEKKLLELEKNASNM